MGSQLLPDHREARGGGAGVPVGGGAHLQPRLCAAGEVCGLLRGRKPGVPPHSHHKRHHAGATKASCNTTGVVKWTSFINCTFFYLLKLQHGFIPQLLKIRPSEPGQEYVEMTFVEHQTCECR